MYIHVHVYVHLHVLFMQGKQPAGEFTLCSACGSIKMRNIDILRDSTAVTNLVMIISTAAAKSGDSF